MRYTFPLTLAALIAAPLSGCDAFVEDVDGPIDRVVSDSLDTQANLSFLVTGVREGFNDSYDLIALTSSLLSDEGYFDSRVDGTTFPTFRDIDNGEIEFDNNTVDGVYNALNEYRFLADDLLRRVETTVEFSDDAEGTDARQSATFQANLHGGIARYLLATYFGLAPTEGGGVITVDPDAPSAFTPSAEMYALAAGKLTAALASAPTDYDRRVVNSLLARNALYAGNPAGAFAADGLEAGDAPFDGQYSASSVNEWWSNGGQGRTQTSVADRFAAYQAEGDARVTVEVAPLVASAEGTVTIYRQALYPTSAAPIPFMSWQETALIAAEAALDSGGDALPLANAVRADAGLEALPAFDLEALIQERDRTLFTQGARLVDQRRFGLPFTRPGGVVGPWRYLPITQTERNANPNF